MASFKVVQVSDTHLSAQHAFPVENWVTLTHRVNAIAPDLVIHTGDVTLDGVTEPDQLAFARERFALLDAETLVLPGNHDVGETPGNNSGLEPVVTQASCDRFTRCFGQDRFVRDIEGWRLVGLNALLLGSELDREADVWAFLDDAMSGADGRPVAVFMHKPLYKSGPDPGSQSTLYLPGAAMQRLRTSLGGHGIALVATGHIHEHRIWELDGAKHVWAPSTSFVADEIMSEPTGTRRVGFVEHDFEPGRVTSTVVCPEDMTTHQFFDHPDLYPEFQKRARASIEQRG